MKNILLVMTFLSIFAVGQENLLKNGTFDNDNIYTELYTDYVKDTFQLSRFVEEYTWNRCLKAELKNFDIRNGKRTVHISLMFGKNGRLCGFPVKPNTIYQFSFECKGRYFGGVGIKACSWHGQTTNVWDKSRTYMTTSVTSVPLNKDWTTYKGTFKTGPEAEQAALLINLWGDEAQQSNFKAEVGDYMLLDNISVSRKTDVLTATDETPSVTEIIEDREFVGLPATLTKFINAANGEPTVKATYQAEVKNDDNGFILTVNCDAKTPVKANVHDRKTSVWQDDVFEVFFGPSPKKDRILSQFVVCAGGARYMGRSIGEINEYDTWQATATVTPTGWQAVFTIPYTTLGFDGKPAPGTDISFNISAQHDGELASWSLVRNKFHDVEKFNFIIFGTPKDYAAKLLRNINNRPASLAAQCDAIAAGNLPLKDINVKYRELQEQIKNLTLGNAKFLLGRRSPTGSFALPIDINLEDILLDGTKPIELKAAVNETIPLPLTLTNRTKNLATYRVILHPNCKTGDVETLGLQPNFPAGHIEMREALAMKDGDNFGTALRFDALPLMNQAYVITVPAGQTSVVWINFNCQGVAPGKYTGAIRVIPLAEPAKMDHFNYTGDMKDYNVSLEVIPITLDIDNPLIPCWLEGNGVNEDFFTLQTDLMDRYFAINPWAFKFKFDDKGNIVNDQLPDVEEFIRTRVQWFEKLHRRNGILFLVHFSTYPVFAEQYMPKSIKEMTPEWRNCWINNLLAIKRLFNRAGVKDDEWGMELFDEPNGKNFTRDLEVCKIAHETLPQVFRLITWAAPNFGNGIDNIRQFDKYLTGHCFWASYCTNPKFRDFMKELQERKKDFGIYYCSTSMRESLHSYYRLHPWRVWECGANHIGLYTLCDASYGIPGATNWKKSCYGGILYRSGEYCIPSIRLEALRQGLMDNAYLSKLKRLADHGDTPLHQEAKRFLETAPRDAIKTFAHDPAAPDRLRQKTIDLILKLQK